MGKQLNIDLRFNADVSQAKAQIQSLVTSLNEVAKSPASSGALFDDRPLREASRAAVELKGHLEKAVNVNTGKLDLSRFSTSLKSSGKTLTDYTATLMSIGSVGQQAFLQLANSISMADNPTTRLNSKMQEFSTTLKNTAKWQISSSILHGFMGSVQTAYNYAKDLNRSLNDIRIVTGASIDDMSKFADEANRAAKALSSTTKEYTNASLIFHQQGLSETEVAKRTEVTLKMANVSRQSAEVVSDQMTAVWNNFYDGSKSLEYYADVMTALGAKTASSSDEIAGGLEKFAAIGDTIGLSYEYAAAALATITSNTRQSEEVVGTALKTIFARIQGLKLGETLEDGTSLNKYSEALQSVGISIFDSAGQLKNMDNILAEMGAKWNNLNKNQQVALAQTVAGTRQYTQLVALMDNWDDGATDSMMANLSTISSSSGALQEQADIYAESWEAASDRVQTSAENIYQNLINDEFFIDLANGIDKVLQSIGGLVEGLGGMEGVMLNISSIFLTSFAKKMPETLSNLKQNLMVFTGQGDKLSNQMRDELRLDLGLASADPTVTEGFKLQAEGISRVNDMKQQLIVQQKHMNSLEVAEYERKIQNVQAIYEEITALQKKKEAAEEVLKTSQKEVKRSGREGAEDFVKKFNTAMDKKSEYEKKSKEIEDKQLSMIDNKKTSSDRELDKYDSLEQEKEINNQNLNQANEEARQYEEILGRIAEKAGLVDDEFSNLVSSNGKLSSEQIEKINNAIDEMIQNYQEAFKEQSKLVNLTDDIKAQATGWKEAAKQIKDFSNSGKNTQKVGKEIEVMKSKMTQYIQKLKEASKNGDIKIPVDKIKSFEKSIKGLDVNNIEEIASEFGEISAEIEGINAQKIRELDDKIDSLRNTLNNDFGIDTTDFERATEAVESLDGKMLNAKNNAEGLGNEIPESGFKASQAFTEFGGAVTSAFAVVTSIQSAINVFGDESSTAFEKVGAAIAILTSITSAFNSIQQLSITLSKKDAFLEIGRAASKAGTTLATKILTKAKDEETKAVWANNLAWLSNPVMWIGLVIIGVVAAIALLVTGISALTNALGDGNSALQKKKENLEAISNSYEAAKNKAQEFKDTVSNYDEAIKSLEELKNGTVEYTEKLQIANEEATKLIKNNPSLKYSVNDQGLIEFENREEAFKIREEKLAKNMGILQQAEVDAELQVISEKTLGAITEVSAGFSKLNDAKELTYIDSMETNETTAHIREVNDIFNSLIGTFSSADWEAFQASPKKYAQEIENIINEQGKSVDATYVIDEIEKALNNTEAGAKAFSTSVKELINDNALNRGVISANTEALLKQKFGNETVEENGNAETYGANELITNEKIQEYNTAHFGEGKEATDVFSGKVLSTLDKNGKIDLEAVYNALGINPEDLKGDEYFKNEGGKIGVYSSEANGYIGEQLEYKAFDDLYAQFAGNIEVTSEMIEKYLNDSTTFKAAQQSAISSGIYTEDDLLRKYDDSINGIKDYMYGIKQGTAEGLVKEFGVTDAAKNNTEQFLEDDQLYNNNEEETLKAINSYLDNLDDSLKQGVAEKILELGEEGIEEAGGIDKALEQSEFETKYENELATGREEAVGLGFSAEEFDAVTKGIQELAEAGDETYESVLKSGQACAEAAKEYLRLNKAVADLNENQEEYNSILQDLKAGGPQKYTAALTDEFKNLKKSIAGLIDTSEEFVDIDFIANLDPKVLQKAAKGDVEAINSIRDSFLETQMTALGMKDKIDETQAALDSLEPGEPIDINADNSQFLVTLMDSMIQAGYSSEQIKKALSGIGINADVQFFEGNLEQAKAAAKEAGYEIAEDLSMDAEINTMETEQETKEEIPDLEENVTVDDVTAQANVAYKPTSSLYDSVEVETLDLSMPEFKRKTDLKKSTDSRKKSTAGAAVKTKTADGKTSGGFLGVKNVHKSVPSMVAPSSAPKSTGSGSGNNGSSSSTPKKNKRQRTTRKTEIVKPYEQLEKQLDKVNDEIDDVSKSLDGLYGNARLKALDKYNEGLGKQIKALEKVRAEGKFHKENAKKELIDFVNTEFNYDGTGGLAGILGIPLEFDADGNIANLDRIRTTYWEERKEMEDHMNTLKTDEERQAYKEQFYDPLVDTFDWLEELIVAYDEANEKIKETEDAIKDARKEIQANNYEKITYAIDLELEINELDLQKLELLLEKYMRINSTVFDTKDLGANFNKITNNLQMQMIESIQNAEIAQRERANALEQLNKNEINMEQYVELTDKSAQTIVDSYQSALDTINKLFDALSDRISLAFDKINQFFGEFDHINAVLDHKLNIDKLINGEEGNLSNQIKLVQTQQDVIQSTIASYENALPVLDSMRSSLEAEIAAMKASNTDGQYDEYIARLEEQLDATIEEINSNKEALASAIEEWGELITQELELTLTKIRKQFERNMFDEGSADAAQEAIARLNASQEEMLTTTNKIYETNKLIRDIENEMDKTNNKRAKQQLAAFAQQIEQKQKSEKLSKFELELAQADYEILKAKIALEEAQQAKSTVRLRRDSEGNYGYFYTDDENNIAEAEQKLADAQNNRYNIALEGAQTYSEKILQTEIDLTNTLADLEEQRISGAITEREWEQKVAEATEYYTNLRAEAQKLYGIAVETMTEEAAENTEDYTTRAGQSMGDFTMNVNRYVQQQRSAFDSYDAKLTQVTKSSEKNFGTMEKAMDYARESADNLQDKFVNELAPAITNTVIPAIQGLNKELAELIRLMAEAGLEDMALDSLTKAAAIKKAVATDWSKEDGGFASGIIALVESGVGYFSEEMQDILNDRFYKVITSNKLGYDDTDYITLIKEARAEGDLAKETALEYMQKYAILNHENWAELSQSIEGDVEKQKRYKAYSLAKAGDTRDQKEIYVSKDAVWSEKDLWDQIETDYKIDGTTNTYTSKNAITALLAREKTEEGKKKMQDRINDFLWELDRKYHQEAEGYQTSMNAADNIPVLESKYEATGNTERDIYKFLEAQGLTKAGIAGLMGNLVAESELIPQNLQNDYEKSLGHTDSSYTQAVDKGTYNNFVGDSAGYGLAQWTSSDRKQGLLNLAKERKTSIGDLETQLLFLMQELKQSHPEVLKVLKTTNDIREATAIVLRQFERPKDQSDSVVSKRMANGEKYLNFNTDIWGFPLEKRYPIYSDYGQRDGGYHYGLDFDTRTGEAVLAVAPGQVITAGWSDSAGNWVQIKHDDGIITEYMHMHSLPVVKVGKRVLTGTVLGYTGSTGDSTGDHLHFSARNKNGELFNPKSYLGFDTGGYTGAWGPEGKLAMLHEKEIVLNKRDTKNFLDSVAMLREVSRQIDINAMIASLGALPLSALTIDDTADKILQQEVTIHADFPNVQDHNEIELAIDNLINAASQYAYKR